MAWSWRWHASGPRDYLTSDHPFDADTVVEMLMTVLAGALRAARTADPELDVEPVIQALELPDGPADPA